MNQEYRFLQGQRLSLTTICQTAVTLRAWARVIYDDGTDELISVPEMVRSSGRTEETVFADSIAIQDGWVVAARVECLDPAAVKRGEAYARLQFDPFGCLLLQDYCYTTGDVSLGTFRESGPGGGSGFRHIITIKSESAPVASTSYGLVITEMIRKINGYIWFYVASADVATRTLKVQLRYSLGAVPTGMSATRVMVLVTGDLVLTASESGLQFADEERFGNNDGGVTIESDPTPFPIWITEDQDSNRDVRFVTTNPHANDLDTIYLDVEEWLMI